MNMPDWLDYMHRHSYYYAAEQLPEVARILEMAKDAWAMAFYRGTEEALTDEQFCAKYSDEGAGI